MRNRRGRTAFAVALSALLIGASIAPAMAQESAPVVVDGKVKVCKYVNTPGEETERLKPGRNPVEVSLSTLGADEDVEIGDEFADGQGKSVVVAWNTQQGECEGVQPPPLVDITDECVEEDGAVTIAISGARPGEVFSVEGLGGSFDITADGDGDGSGTVDGLSDGSYDVEVYDGDDELVGSSTVAVDCDESTVVDRRPPPPAEDVIEPSASIVDVCVENVALDYSYTLDNSGSDVEVVFAVNLGGVVVDIPVAAGATDTRDESIPVSQAGNTLQVGISAAGETLASAAFDAEDCVVEVGGEIEEQPPATPEPEPEPEVEVKGEVVKKSATLARTGVPVFVLSLLGLLSMAGGGALLRRGSKS